MKIKWVLLFLQTYAVPSISSQNISVRANTSKRSRSIVTSKRALISKFYTLVHVFADLISTRSKPIVAGTLETSFDISTGTIATNTLCVYALVLIDASTTGIIENITGWTFASKRAIGIYTVTTWACVLHEETFVQINSCIISARSFRAQPLKFLCKIKYRCHNKLPCYLKLFIKLYVPLCSLGHWSQLPPQAFPIVQQQCFLVIPPSRGEKHCPLRKRS